MRKERLTKTIIALLIVISSGAAKAIEGDKAQHFTASAIISSGAYISCTELKCTHPAATAFLLTLGIGAAKELTDEKFDKRDLLSDILGAGLPLFLWEF